MAETKFHKPNELCETGTLPYGYRKVLNMIDSGEIQAINVGTEKRKIWRITDEELNRILDRLKAS